MFEVLDRQTHLSANQNKIVVAAIIGGALEFLDYFLIGFVLAFIIRPLGLALIIGASDVLKPGAPVANIVPAFIYLGSWFAMAGAVYLFLGIETKGRSIEEIDRSLTASSLPHAVGEVAEGRRGS